MRGRGFQPGNPADWQKPARGRWLLFFAGMVAAGAVAGLLLVFNWYPARVIVTGTGPQRESALPQALVQKAKPALPGNLGRSDQAYVIRETPSFKAVELGRLARKEKYEVVGHLKKKAEGSHWTFIKTRSGLMGWIPKEFEPRPPGG